MKTVDEYMKMAYRMEIVKDENEDSYIVSFPDLKGCLTCGNTPDEAFKNAEDAKRKWIQAALEDGYDIPEPRRLEDYSGQFKIRIPKTLHRELVLKAKEEGVSMNQLCLYALTKA